MSAPRVNLVEKKGLLVTRAELDRARVLLAIRDVKAIVAPGSTPERAARYRPAAAMLMGFLGPATGSRIGNWLRLAWIALAVLRLVRARR